MALKGITRIELTDVKTGQKEVIEKHNLVTNAISDLVSMNPDGYLWNANYEFSNNLIPICPNAIGGVLLYENALEENPEKYYAPADNPLIGYSSNNVNSADDNKRGSINQLESGLLEDRSGYRFVFDFTTSQANGTISALGLTSKFGGVSGYGSMQDYKNAVRILNVKTNTSPSDNNRLAIIPTKYEMIAGLSDYGEYGYYAYVSAQNKVTVGKIRTHLSNVSLAITTGPSAEAIEEPTVISTQSFASGGSGATRYYNFMDGGDGYIWGIEHAGGVNGNASGNANLNWIKVSKEDFSATEGTFTINAKLRAMGIMPGETATASTDAIAYSAIHNGYLYCVNNTRTGVVKISLSNPTDVVELFHPDGVVITPNPQTKEGSASMFNVVGDIVYFGNGHIVNNEIIPTSYSNIDLNVDYNETYPVGLKGGKSPNLRFGPFLIQYMFYNGNTSHYTYRIISLMTPYLATINNLEKPVEKTADKTMKITYILREE